MAKENTTNTKKNKHLTYDERSDIQSMLKHGSSFAEIARTLGKDPGTISKEVRGHIEVSPAKYIKKDAQGNVYQEICTKLQNPPYVCNGCSKRNHCQMQKQYYYAKKAQEEYEENLHGSRTGIALNKESFYQIDEAIREGIEKGQHIYQIVKANNLDISLSSVYRYSDAGYLTTSAIDFPRKVKFKPRKKKDKEHVPAGLKIGRSYADFLSHIAENEITSWVEMDTVIGEPGGKLIMTFIFTASSFMFAILLDSKKASESARAIKELKGKFQDSNISFGELMPVILTDNGGEFSDVYAFENNLDGEVETHLFFCDPMKSCQKPHVEKNHTLFRDICPKGTSFDNLTQDDINTIFSHVNSVARKKLNGKTPYDLFEFTYGKEITSLLGIQRIPDKEVIQTPILLQQILKSK